MTIKQQYKKERKRILNYISKARKEGYDVSKVSVPSIPKKITRASVRRLEKITADVLSKTIQGYYKGVMLSMKTIKRKEAKIRAERRRSQRKMDKDFREARERDKKAKEELYQRIREKNERQFRESESWKEEAGKLAEEKITKEGVGDFAQITLIRFQTYMLGYPQKVYNIVMNAINRAIDIYGANAVAEAIYQTGDLVEHFLSGIYGQSGDDAYEFTTTILRHIPELSDADISLIENIIEGE